MEDWKLQSLINDFTDATGGEQQALIDATKHLRFSYKHILNDKHKKNVLDALIPLLDSPDKLVAHCAYSVISGKALEQCMDMPSMTIYLVKKDGSEIFKHTWHNKNENPPSLGLMDFGGGAPDSPQPRGRG